MWDKPSLNQLSQFPHSISQRIFLSSYYPASNVKGIFRLGKTDEGECIASRSALTELLKGNDTGRKLGSLRMKSKN